jgi:hypothetical protein
MKIVQYLFLFVFVIAIFSLSSYLWLKTQDTEPVNTINNQNLTKQSTDPITTTAPHATEAISGNKVTHFDGWQLYQNTEAGFRFEYPQNWSFSLSDDSKSALAEYAINDNTVARIQIGRHITIFDITAKNLRKDQKFIDSLSERFNGKPAVFRDFDICISEAQSDTACVSKIILIPAEDTEIRSEHGGREEIRTEVVRIEYGVYKDVSNDSDPPSLPSGNDFVQSLNKHYGLYDAFATFEDMFNQILSTFEFVQ